MAEKQPFPNSRDRGHVAAAECTQSQTVVATAVKLALAVNCDSFRECKFERSVSHAQSCRRSADSDSMRTIVVICVVVGVGLESVRARRLHAASSHDFRTLHDSGGSQTSHPVHSLSL